MRNTRIQLISIGIVCAVFIACTLLITTGCQDETSSTPLPTVNGQDFDNDGDFDGDGVSNAQDNCLLRPNPDQIDLDQDGVGDHCDNCPQRTNSAQLDGDRDGYGDSCDVCASDYRYALASEAQFCGGASSQEYSFSIVNQAKVQYTDAPNVRYDYTPSRFGKSIAYLGGATLSGAPGAVLAVGNLHASAYRFTSGISSGHHMLLFNLRPDLSVDIVPYIYSVYSSYLADHPSDRRNPLYEIVDMDGRIGRAVSDMGVHTINGRERKLIAMSDKNSIRIIALSPRTTWRDPDSPHEALSIIADYQLEDISDAQSSDSDCSVYGYDAPSPSSSAYLGRVSSGDTESLLLAVGFSHDAIAECSRTLLLRIDPFHSNFPLISTTLVEVSEQVHGFGQGVAHVPQYDTANERVLAVIAHGYRSPDNLILENKGMLYLYRLTPQDSATAVHPIAVRARDGGSLGRSSLYTRELYRQDNFTALHNLGDLDGPDGPAATVLAVGCERCDGAGSTKTGYPVGSNSGAVLLLYLSAVKQDGNDRPYVELLKYEVVNGRMENGPLLRYQSYFGSAITSFEIGDKKYLAVGASGENAFYFLEYR